MKKLIKYAVFFAALISLIFLYSCYVSSSFGNSGIRLHFKNSYLTSSARALGDTSNSTARVYLLDSNNAVFPLGEDKEYKESVISSAGTDVNLDNIPAGSGYRVLISIGNLSADGKFLDVAQYGQSEQVSISSGSIADVNITLKDSPFSKYLKGKEIMGVKINPADNWIYAADSTGLYSGTDPGSMENNRLSLSDTGTSYEVQSLSIGKVISGTSIIEDQVWLNTDKGILPYNGSSFNTNFSKNLSGVTKILDSGALDVSIDTPAVSIFYQVDGGLGGVYVTDSTKDTPKVWDWLNIDLSDIISGQPVSSFYITDNYAYFATKLGAFRLSADIITTYNGNDIPDLMDYADFFSVTDSKGEIPIISLAGYTSGSDAYLVIGTERGAYTVKLTESDPENVFATTATPELVNGTAGYNITKIAVTSSASYIAMLSDRDLFISNGSAVTHYPFNSGLPGTLTDSGLPGKLTDFTWFNDTELLISGTEGLVSITP